MTTSKYTFECITPCFCTGENQAVRELRPASIRGSLRWWFRALGGSAELETQTFGGANPITASAVQIRVDKIEARAIGQLPPVRGIDPLSYILYFPSVSGAKKGMRWTKDACYGTGTTFELHIRQLRALSKAAQQKLDEAIAAFRCYGSVGMHITRGLGAIQDSSTTDESWISTDESLKERGFVIRKSNKSHDTWDSVLKEAGQWLQNDLRKEFGAGGNRTTALGSAQPVRQTSAIYLRPIKKNGKLLFAAFEAPHAKVLGDVSKRRHREPVLQSRDFTGTPPSAPTSGPRRMR